MLGSIEKFLFETFPKMPKSVRVFTYLFLLFLFAYMILVPKFVNGQLVVKKGGGGTMSYRGGELRQHVEGRVFNYKVNEHGYWSIPVVSMLPHAVEIEVYNVDADAWFPVRFDWLSIWTKDSYKLEVAFNPDRVQIMESRIRSVLPANLVAELAQLIGLQALVAHAGMLIPRSSNNQTPVGGDGNVLDIKIKIIDIISKVTGKEKNSLSDKYMLTGSENSPSYVQRIEIINRVEKQFEIKIPDEHWTYIRTIRELVDYVYKKTSAPDANPTNANEQFKFLR